MENKKIGVMSTVDATVGIDDPQVRFQRRWEKRGVVRQIEFETLQELLYNPGILAMFEEGILYIDDMEAKIELGLEEEGSSQPTNIIVLTDDQKKRYMKNAPLRDLQEICGKLTETEINNLIDYAITNEIVDYDKSNYLKKLTGRDIIKTIELNRADTND